MEKKKKKKKGKTIYKELQPLYVYLAQLKARIEIKFCNNKNIQIHINCKSASLYVPRISINTIATSIFVLDI